MGSAAADAVAGTDHALSGARFHARECCFSAASIDPPTIPQLACAPRPPTPSSVHALMRHKQTSAREAGSWCVRVVGQAHLLSFFRPGRPTLQ